MTIETQAFDKYIEKLHEQIWLLINTRKGFGGPEDVERANKVWCYDFGALHTESENLFAPALRELRKNLIGIDNDNIIINYRNYLQKSIDDLIDVITSQVVDLAEPAEFEDFLKSDHSTEAFSFGSWDNAVYEINNYLKDNVRDEDLKSLKDQVLGECDEELKLRGHGSSPVRKLPGHPLKWKGTPAQLAFIINLLEEKGYIDESTHYGERKAKIILSHFEIEGHNTTPESLGRSFQQIKRGELPINPDDAVKFSKFPKRSDLKK